MTKSPTIWLRALAAAAIAGLAVVTPVEFLLLPLAVGAILMVRWSRRGGRAERIVPSAVAILIVLLAATAPVETVADRVMRRPMKVPRLAMTIAEMSQPVEHELPRFSPQLLFNPAEPDDRVVRFAARDMNVGEFIATIEAQTGMRRKFVSCGNGATILWGVDNIMYIGFVEPKR